MDQQPKQQNVDLGDPTYRTASQLPRQVFVLCPPWFVSNKIANNVWIKELKGKDREIDIERFVGEWLNLLDLLTPDSMIILLPPKKGLQDETFVNSFVYLPHIKDKDIIILANFTGAGRAGEEVVAANVLKEWGYLCVKNPFKFEGYPELKYLRENIYFGGHGFRSEPKAHLWIERNYGAKIIQLKETDEKLYHLDCSVFVLDQQNVIVCTEAFTKEEVKSIEKVATIHSVTKQDCHENACNIIRVGDMIVVASSLQFLKSSDPEFKKEWHRNERLQKICNDLGLECVFLEMDQASRSGAALSCFCTPLNVRI